jgi:CRP-like cAMP-binding protein
VPSRLLVLDLAGFRALRAEGSVVSVAIEEYALDLLTDGLDRARQRVGQLSTGRPIEDFVPKQGFFDVLADAIGMGGIMATRCNATKALQLSPLFRNAEPAHLQGIAARMHALKAQAGSFFLKQGEANTSMFLVVSGTVDVITAPRDDRAVRHETLGPGELFGLWAMLRDHPSRTTVIASTKCVVLELDKLAWAELAPAHTGTGSVLRLAVLRALTARLVQESARLASLEAGHAPEVMATQSGSFMTINPIDRR